MDRRSNVKNSNSNDEVSLATKLREQVSLDNYRIEKSQQVVQYHNENKRLNPKMADKMLENCRRKIFNCRRSYTTREDIDELVKIYYDELLRCEFHGDGDGVVGRNVATIG